MGGQQGSGRVRGADSLNLNARITSPSDGVPIVNGPAPQTCPFRTAPKAGWYRDPFPTPTDAASGYTMTRRVRSKATAMTPQTLTDPLALTRRHFLSSAGLGLGALALNALLPRDAGATDPKPSGGLPGLPHFPPRAKRVIYLFQSGGPSQIELFDYKPLLNEKNGQQLPDHVRGGQRLTGMSVNQASIPLAGSVFKFARHGQCGAWVSELLPHTAGVADQLC